MPVERYAVLGNPVNHSLSPVMQEAAFRSAGIDACYERIPVRKEKLCLEVMRLRDEGYRGINLTIPHKESGLLCAHRNSRQAVLVGAINTLVNDGGTLVGYNTDVSGFALAVSGYHSRLNGGRALVFGNGGAARAVLVALRGIGVEVAIVCRDIARGGQLVERLGAARAYTFDSEEVLLSVESADLIVNATPLGMSHLPAESPLPPGACLRSATIVVDLIYGTATPLLQAAIRAGCDAQNGTEMLVQQGAAAFRLWTGIHADVGAMRRACHSALEARMSC